jgi:hypothetical protein
MRSYLTLTAAYTDTARGRSHQPHLGKRVVTVPDSLIGVPGSR